MTQDHAELQKQLFLKATEESEHRREQLQLVISTMDRPANGGLPLNSKLPAQTLDLITERGIGTATALTALLTGRAEAGLDHIVAVDSRWDGEPLENMVYVGQSPKGDAFQKATVVVVDEANQLSTRAQNEIAELIIQRTLTGVALPKLELVILIRSTGGPKTSSLAALGSSTHQLLARTSEEVRELVRKVRLGRETI